MTAAEQAEFKARLAAQRERVLRAIFGDRKAEARLAEIERGTVRRLALKKEGGTDADG
ncbi:hypothetical protein [Mesorhizobium hawassense]|uniref:hypothetical protein n=1 Tax=Mesorhizobium hawassense TaxID=1209954 RepID=UPI00142DA9C1|nr:hypothetical protein [Mesorhizobium hawassense]